ncbi:MAG: acyl--CoA ligase, partial [Proteobacteria bacterium]|nr:acyl--CoA ligase [Pseudomonadota bacterium]
MQRGKIGGSVFTSISEQISIHGHFRPNNIALIEGAREVSWAQYNVTANLLAAKLAAHGVERGDRVALLVTNGLWAHEALLAIWRCGAAAVPLSPMLKAAQLHLLLEDCGASRLLVSPEHAPLATEVAGNIPVLSAAALALLPGDVTAFIPHAPD